MDNHEDYGYLGKVKRITGDWIKQHIFYGIVFLSSFIILVFFPMMGTSVNGWRFSSYKPSDWAFYIGTKLMVSILNFVIFYSFCKQGELNVRNTEGYKKAIELLGKRKYREYIPLSPNKWKRKQYLNKGLTLSISSIASLCIFTDVIIKYDWMALISYIVVIAMAVVFGLIQVSVSEDYWGREFYEYAVYINNKESAENAEVIKEDKN